MTLQNNDDSGRGGGHKPAAVRPIFSDPSHRRARGLRVITVLFVLALAYVFGTILMGLLNYPQIDSGAIRPAAVNEAAPVTDETEVRAALDCPDETSAIACATERSSGFLAAVDALPRADFDVRGFMPTWPDWRFISGEAHARDLDVLMPQVFQLDPGTGALAEFDPESEAIRRSVAAAKGVGVGARVVPVVEMAGDGGPVAVREDRLQDMAEQLSRASLTGAFDGLCLDIRSDGPSLLELAERLAHAIQAQTDWGARELCLVMPPGDVPSTAMTEEGAFDRYILSLPNPMEVSASSAPGEAEAGLAALERGLSGRSDLDRFSFAIGTEALAWGGDVTFPDHLSFAEAMAQVRAAGGQVRYSGAQGASYAEFLGAGGAVTTIWFQDVASAYTAVSRLASVGLRSFTVWPMGGEDPGIWALLSEAAAARRAIVAPELGAYAVTTGTGPLLGYSGYPVTGTRVLEIGDNGPVPRMLSVPSPHRLTHWAALPPLTVSLTFDDGPDTKFTPQILDILAAREVPATFFLIGSKVGPNAETVQRAVTDGHTVGSHSFTHPQFETSSTSRIDVEAALLQKALETAVDRTTKVMRLPYARGTGPLDGFEAAPVAEISELGYVLVNGDLVPPDWTQASADDIVDHILTRTEDGLGKVIVLHDGGGDRSNVVEALPRLIDALRARGYRFIGLPEIVGVERDALIPPVTAPPSWQDQLTIFLLGGLTNVLKVSFWIVIGIGTIRSLAVLVLAEARRPHVTPPVADSPAVDVFVPAYCERGTVVATVEAILASDYPNLNVIAVDDGSTDDTLAVLQAAFGDHPKVTILTKENGGKSSALNLAIDHARSDVFVAIDADTLLDPMAISRLVRHFEDPRIGAVAGNVKVGNRRNLLTRFQALEYITAQNMDRRAAELVNGILVVPGAIGAWRRAAVQAAGGYPRDTLAEDADLTVAVNRAGYRVIYDPSARAMTEAPETVRQLFRQRLRWTLGMMQVGWKHRRALREGRGVGFYALPDLLIFGVVMPLLAPFADLVFVFAVAGVVTTLAGGYLSSGVASIEWPILIAYIALPMLDVLIAFVAFRFEPWERKSLMWLLLVQRFYYRQLLYITTIRAFLRALMGRVQPWQRMERTSALVGAADLREPEGVTRG